MKTLLIIATLFFANGAMSQSSELTPYTLDAETPVHKCRIIAHVDGDQVNLGYIESIRGSVINLQISEELDYTIIVDEEKEFEITGNALTSSL